MITPTVGRKVWYRPAHAEIGNVIIVREGQPLDATIVYVWNDRLVNLAIYDHEGFFFRRNSVPLLQDDDAPNKGSIQGHAEWMPYQKMTASRE